METSELKSEKPREVQKALELEKRRHATTLAALNDEQFMGAVIESSQADASGDEGELLSDVKSRLGIV
jgi:hypothetical protein